MPRARRSASFDPHHSAALLKTSRVPNRRKALTASHGAPSSYSPDNVSEKSASISRASIYAIRYTFLRPRHLLRLHQLMEFLFREVSQLQRGFEQASLVHMRGVRDLRRFVVSDLRG